MRAFLFDLVIIRYVMPSAEPITEPSSNETQHPATPVNAPIKESKSISPWPIPSLPVRRVKIFELLDKIKYPRMVPMILSINVIGSNPSLLSSKPTGIKKSVT